MVNPVDTDVAPAVHGSGGSGLVVPQDAAAPGSGGQSGAAGAGGQQMTTGSGGQIAAGSSGQDAAAGSGGGGTGAGNAGAGGSAGAGNAGGSAGAGGHAGAGGSAGAGGRAGAGGNAGASGQGGNIAAACVAIETQYEDALTAAAACDPNMNNQCQSLAPTSLECAGCSVFVNDTSTLDTIQTQWNQANCTSLTFVCPPLVCAVGQRTCAPNGPTSGQRNGSNANAGTCTGGHAATTN